MAVRRLSAEGKVTIPARLRKAANLRAGDPLTFEVTPEGILIRPGAEERDPDQWWFWTEAWQAKEAEADANIAAGRLIRHNSTDEFLAALDEAIARDTR
jgi:AbrB family looped-hinge helix DNA binding protein